MKTELAIIGLVVLEGLAMLCGEDGAFFLPVVAIIGALGGYHARPVIEKVVAS